MTQDEKVLDMVDKIVELTNRIKELERDNETLRHNLKKEAEIVNELWGEDEKLKHLYDLTLKNWGASVYNVVELKARVRALEEGIGVVLGMFQDIHDESAAVDIIKIMQALCNLVEKQGEEKNEVQQV